MPVLLAQAAYLRMRVVVLPEPTGPRSGIVGEGPDIRILILGDSSAAGVGVATQGQALSGQLPACLADSFTVHYDLVAQPGAKTGQVLGWLDHLPQQKYDFVVTALGVNDVTKAVTLRRWLQQQKLLFDRLSSQFGTRRILVSGMPPLAQFPIFPQPLRWVLGYQAARFDQHLHALVAAREDCRAVKIDLGLNDENMARDGFHPGPTVYAAWAQEVARLIIAEFPALDENQSAS